MVSTSVKYIQDNFEEHDRLAVVLIDRTKGFVEQKLLTVPEIVRDGFQAYLHTANASGRDVYLSMNRPLSRVPSAGNLCARLLFALSCGSRDRRQPRISLPRP